MGDYIKGHRYSEDFKNKAVQMLITDRQTPKEVAEKIEVRFSVFSSWLAEPLFTELIKAKSEILRLKKELDKTADERIHTL